MLKIIEQIKTKIQEHKNGKELDKQTIFPIKFVRETIIPAIQKNGLPKQMVNTDKSRQKDQTSAIADIEDAIIDAYSFDKRSGFKKYIDETPYNKMLLWGIMFESLYEVLIGNTLKQRTKRTIKKIDTKHYADLPKRYRGIFKKDDKHPNSYITVLKSKEEKFTVTHNFELDILDKKIRDLISLLYKEEIIDTYEMTIDCGYDEEGRYWESGQIYHRYGQYANTNPTKSNFVSDKQMDAIKELQKIFTKIASEIYVTKTKHGNTEIWDEMQDEQSRNHVFWRAQKLTRTANQLVVSTRKASEFCGDRQIRQATEHYDRVRNDIMSQLRRKTSVRIN